MNVAPKRGFPRSSYLAVSLEFTSDQPWLPWQRKFGNFGEKMAKTRLIQEIEPQRLHQTGVLRSGNLPVSLKFISDRPWLPWQRKFGNFNGKLVKTRLIQEIEPQMLHQTGGFRGQAICQCHRKLRQTDPGCHGNENSGILMEKMAKTRLIQEIEPQCCTKRGFSICWCYWH